MTRKEASETVVKMALLGHNHVPIDALTLLDVFEIDETKSFQKFAVVARYIGEPEGDYESHIDVSGAFAMLLQSNLRFDTRAQRAFSILLRNVVRLPGRNVVEIVADVVRAAGNGAAVRSYAYQWLRGHFLLTIANEDHDTTASNAP